MKTVIYILLLVSLFNYCSIMEYNRNIQGYFLFKEPYEDNYFCIILSLLILGWIITDLAVSKKLKLIIATVVVISIILMISLMF